MENSINQNINYKNEQKINPFGFILYTVNQYDSNSIDSSSGVRIRNSSGLKKLGNGWHVWKHWNGWKSGQMG